MDSGDPRNIWLHEIGKRIPPAHGVGNDREGNSLSTGDMVKITYK